LEGGRILGRPHQGGEEWVADVQDDEPDGAAVAGAQLAGSVIADETQFVDGRSTRPWSACETLSG
jgi:hypothetical protein